MFARTERLLLRPPWPEDAPALVAALDDPAISRQLALVPSPYTLDDARGWLARADGAPALLVIVADGALAGAVGLGPAENADAELGYWIARPYWGRGFATEASAAMLRLARDGLRYRTIVAGHCLDNPASGRVLEKIGFRPTGETRPRHSAARGGEAPSRLYRWTAQD